MAHKSPLNFAEVNFFVLSSTTGMYATVPEHDFFGSRQTLERFDVLKIFLA
jgi:hypothetical protein